jgi:Flp pilus assembly protein TadG
MGEKFRMWRRKMLAFARANRGNVAMMFALSLVPLAIAGGAGLDFARAMMVRSAMSDALDAAALAVGSTPGITSAQAMTLAQKYVDANYTENTAQYGSPTVTSATIVGQSVTLTVTDAMPNMLLSVANILPTTNLSVSSTVVWGQTKLWVALVLDNTGSMCEPDNNPCPGDTKTTIKINALKTASHQLLSTLQNVSTAAGDVMVAIVPFAKDVNIGSTAHMTDTSIDWTDWASPPPYSAPSTAVIAGSSCPISDGCVSGPGSTSSVSKVPSSGMICPDAVNSSSSGLSGHYYDGCWDTETKIISTGSSATCTGYSNCTCSGSSSSKKCTTTGYHVWTVNAHSFWSGCVMDRGPSSAPSLSQTNDENDTSPNPSDITTLFPAENSQSCPAALVTTLSDDWTNLNSQIDTMTAAGGTNQTIGMAHGMQMLTSGSPYFAPTLPANTARYIILLSDGLNTMDRWYGNGSSQSTSVDTRMAAACVNAKAQGIVIYTIFVDLNGTQGNSTVLQNCASDTSKYFDLTTSGGIITTFATIAQQISNLRVSQ